MTKLRLFAAITLTLVITNASAGIRIIGHGGGFAEMQALTAFNHLGLFVYPCVIKPDTCGLSSSEGYWLHELYLRDFKSARMSMLEFFDSEEGETDIQKEAKYSIKLSPFHMAINRKLLYVNGKSKSYGEIAEIVMRNWILRLEITESVEEVHALARKIFTSMHIEHQRIEIGDGPALLHNLKITGALGEPLEPVLALEMPDETEDLIPMIRDQMPYKRNVTILELSQLHEQDGYMVGHLVWREDDKTFKARLAFLIANDEGKFNPSHLHINISNREEITPQDCTEVLSKEPVE